MRLTVGPLPAAVYWRRRVVVLVGLAVVVLVISYACGSSETSTAGFGDPSTSSPASTTPSPSATLLQPTSPTAKPTVTAFTLPAPGTAGPCSDAEIEVTASAASAQVRQGRPVDVTITIKNIASRTCTRDIGADVQELMLMDGTNKIWSSDDCSPNRGRDMNSFTPGKQVSFTLTWMGRRSRTGTGAVDCEAVAPGPNKYALVARLDQKLSPPFEIHIGP